MRRPVTIPFPEGLDGDYACARETGAARQAGTPPPGADAVAEAARALRAGLPRLVAITDTPPPARRAA